MATKQHFPMGSLLLGFLALLLTIYTTINIMVLTGFFAAILSPLLILGAFALPVAIPLLVLGVVVGIFALRGILHSPAKPAPKTTPGVQATKPQVDEKTQRVNLLNTLIKGDGVLATPEKRQQAHHQAQTNLVRWAQGASNDSPTAANQDIPSNLAQPKQRPISAFVSVQEGDWGDVTAARTKTTGKTYAVLNMANAYDIFGGYRKGCAAQEENMARRTDMHFTLTQAQQEAPENPRYTQADQFEDHDISQLINADIKDPDNDQEHLVYLDATTPRVCVRGRENREKTGNQVTVNGYDDLKPEQYFEFYEMRSAADDLRNGRDANGRQKYTTYDKASMRRKIRAQLYTLHKKRIDRVILSAFGCGAFGNPAQEVATLYKQELEKFEQEHPGFFQDVTFAIFYAGYGARNHATFEKVLSGKPASPAPEAKAVSPKQGEGAEGLGVDEKVNPRAAEELTQDKEEDETQEAATESSPVNTNRTKTTATPPKSPNPRTR